MAIVDWLLGRKRRATPGVVKAQAREQVKKLEVVLPGGQCSVATLDELLRLAEEHPSKFMQLLKADQVAPFLYAIGQYECGLYCRLVRHHWGFRDARDFIGFARTTDILEQVNILQSLFYTNEFGLPGRVHDAWADLCIQRDRGALRFVLVLDLLKRVKGRDLEAFASSDGFRAAMTGDPDHVLFIRRGGFLRIPRTIKAGDLDLVERLLSSSRYLMNVP
jgi:hypothetical protein